MEISFDTNELRCLCEQNLAAQDALGTRAAKKLQNRLADIDASGNIDDLLFGTPIRVGTRREVGYRFRLSRELVLDISANHTTNPLDDNGEIDWQNVYRVKVVYLGEANDEQN